MTTPTQEAQRLGNMLKAALESSDMLPNTIERLSVAIDRLAALASAQQANPWRTVIDDALIGSGLDCLGPEEDPKAALNRLLAWREEIAADPRVSDRVQQAEPAADVCIRWRGGIASVDRQTPREVQPLTDEQATGIFRKTFGLIDSRPVGPQLDFIHAIQVACATAWGVKLAGQTKEPSHGS